MLKPVQTAKIKIQLHSFVVTPSELVALFSVSFDLTSRKTFFSADNTI